MVWVRGCAMIHVANNTLTFDYPLLVSVTEEVEGTEPATLRDKPAVRQNICRKKDPARVEIELDDFQMTALCRKLAGRIELNKNEPMIGGGE